MTNPGEVHVACDTNVFWCVLKNNAPWLGDFETMAGGGVVISFGDHALAEISNQLEQGDFTEAEYAACIEKCSRFISARVPVLPGKRKLAAWCRKNPDATGLQEDEAYRSACWKLMTGSKSLVDFERGITYCLAGGLKKKIPLKRGEAAKLLEKEREDWRQEFGTKRPDWERQKIDDRLKLLAGDLNQDIDCDPKLMVRLDAALRHEDAVIRLVNQGMNVESEKRRNDGIDYNMAYVFMKRILLCTAERKYLGCIRNLESFQSGWIFQPHELVERWKAGTLERPAWP